MVDEIAAENAERVAKNVRKLGPAKLAALDDKIKAAVKANSQPVPDEFLKKFKIPSISDITWIVPVRARSNGIARESGPARNDVQRHIDSDGAELPLFVQFERA